VKPRYKESTNISSRVAKLNPWWNEKNVDLMDRFLKAVEMTGSEFKQRVEYLGLSWLPARDIVARCLKARFDVHPSGKIMVMDQFCPWKEHLHDLEKELDIQADQQPLYVLYEDDREKAWRIQAVATQPSSFESRKALPEPWRVFFIFILIFKNLCLTKKKYRAFVIKN
jgi:uncharacterized UPF0160 family protein